MGPIILGKGPMLHAPEGAVIIDHRAGDIWRDGEIVGHASPGTVRFRIVSLLLASMPGIIRYPDLYEAIWGDDESGGPEGARYTVATTLVVWRPMLERLGITVRSVNGFGFDVQWASPEAVASDKLWRSAYSNSARLPAPDQRRQIRYRPSVPSHAGAA